MIKSGLSPTRSPQLVSSSRHPLLRPHYHRCPDRRQLAKLFDPFIYSRPVFHFVAMTALPPG